jgi:hypothetical protein
MTSYFLRRRFIDDVFNVRVLGVGDAVLVKLFYTNSL